jgi:hypothetical protein
MGDNKPVVKEAKPAKRDTVGTKPRGSKKEGGK